MSAVTDLSTWADVPGGAGRWTLADIHTGLDSMAEVYSLADKMADELTLYTTVQGITMQMLILRFIKVLSAQKRLSILTTTAVKVCHSQSHLCLLSFLLYFCFLVPWGAECHNTDCTKGFDHGAARNSMGTVLVLEGCWYYDAKHTNIA